MTTEPSVSALLGARAIAAKVNPNLLAWTAGAWEGWVRSQRDARRSCAQQLVAVVKLSALEDLPLHVGLMQLLAMQDVHCRIVLALPTDFAARIASARARRQGWQNLVRILTSAELPSTIERLPAATIMAVFPFPAMLGRQALGRLSAILSGVSDDQATVSESGPVLGKAADYSAWANASSFIDPGSSLRDIMIQDPKRIALARGGGRASDAPTHLSAQGVSPIVHGFESGLEMPGLRNGGELLVTALAHDGEDAVIVRQRGDLLDPDRPVRLRLPAGLLTVTPQRIRAECREAGQAIASREFLFHVPPSRLKPWMISAFLNRGGGGNPVIRAFAHGTGCRIAYAEDEPATLQDIPVVWGVLRQSDRILTQAKDQGLYFFYIDHAYFDRGHGKSYRITRNGYEAGPVRKCPADRIADLGVDLKPWRTSGRDIIVCPPTDYFMQAHGCADWLDQTLTKLRGLTDRPVTVRMKPQPGEQAEPLPEALERAHALVTHSSNVAIEAACLGTPVFVDAASAAAPVGLTDLSMIEAPVYPDRDKWLAHLAYSQFSFEEIGDGRAWQMLLDLEEREYA
jgi:hypothetical protein